MPGNGRCVVSRLHRHRFQNTPAAASQQWGSVTDKIKPKVPKLVTLIDSAEQNVLAYIIFLEQHWAKPHTRSLIGRLNGEIKRCVVAVDIFRNDDPIIRLIAALLR